MKTTTRSSSRLGLKRSLQFALATAICLLPTSARGDIVNVGTLSYDTFIPAGNGSSGIDAFDLLNLTGAFSLPPDFPVVDDLIFHGAVLTLTLSDLSHEVFTLGDIGPGFLVDGGGNPIVQVPGDDIFDSAEFKATLSPMIFGLSDGTSFTAASSVLDVLLLPSTGSTLSVDVDQTSIGVSRAGGATVPEPESYQLILLAGPWLVWSSRRMRRPK